MSNEHLINVDFQYIDKTVSPWVYHSVLNAMDGLDFGDTIPALRVTNYSDTRERYIGGLEDGDEFQVVFARDYAESPNIQAVLRGLKNTTKSFRVTITDRTVSPQRGEYLDFDALILGTSRPLATADANKMALNLKINGDTTYTDF